MLPEILAHKRKELQGIDRPAAIAGYKETIRKMPPVHSLRLALIHANEIALIAEVKRKSPSKGQLAKITDAGELAGCYAAAGARAISVLTDQKYFDGSLEDLVSVRAAVELPILRKDFIVDPCQVYQARAAGADVVLLIAAALPAAELKMLYTLASDIGLEVLLEIHNETELEMIAPLNPAIVGVNSRNLATFVTDLSVAEQLRPLIPITTACVAESGIHSRDDMVRMKAAGFDGVLIGEGIVTATDRVARIRELLGVHAHTS